MFVRPVWVKGPDAERGIGVSRPAATLPNGRLRARRTGNVASTTASGMTTEHCRHCLIAPPSPRRPVANTKYRTLEQSDSTINTMTTLRIARDRTKDGVVAGRTCMLGCVLRGSVGAWRGSKPGHRAAAIGETRPGLQECHHPQPHSDLARITSVCLGFRRGLRRPCIDSVLTRQSSHLSH